MTNPPPLYLPPDYTYVLVVKRAPQSVQCTLVTPNATLTWVESGTTCHVSPAERTRP